MNSELQIESKKTWGLKVNGIYIELNTKCNGSEGCGDDDPEWF